MGSIVGSGVRDETRRCHILATDLQEYGPLSGARPRARAITPNPGVPWNGG